MKGPTAFVTVSFLILTLIACVSKRPAPAGALLFQSERCIYCHTFKGSGAKIGPDLTDVTKRRSEEWIRDQIREPRSHKTDSGMPPHEYLSGKEIDAIIAYLKS